MVLMLFLTDNALVTPECCRLYATYYRSGENPQNTSGKHEFPLPLNGHQLYLKTSDYPIN